MDMENKKIDVDSILQKSLACSEKPDVALVHKVKYEKCSHMKKTTIRRSFSTVAAAVLVFAVLSISVYAAAGLLLPRMTIGDPNADVSHVTVTREEATQIGLNALVEYFGANLNEFASYLIDVSYSPSFNPLDTAHDHDTEGWDDDWEVPAEFGSVQRPVPGAIQFPVYVRRGVWQGSISIPNHESSDTPMIRPHDVFRFAVDAETGRLVNIQYFISENPVERIGSQYREDMGSAHDVFTYVDSMAAQHNIEYANFAMQFAEESNLVDGEILRAIVISGGWIVGRGDSSEIQIFTAVETVDGEVIVLTLQGRNRKELTGIDFPMRWLSHAINEDGSITEAVSTGIATGQNSPFGFDWVYR